MSDLLKKLRDNEQGFHLGADGMGWSPDLSLFGEAADEIERLQVNGIHTCNPDCQRIACVQRREIERLTAERDAVTGYATYLAEAIHAKHYAHIGQWRPLPDALGLLTQIDNMTSGLIDAARGGKKQG